MMDRENRIRGTTVLFLTFCHLIFEFVQDFDIRISNFILLCGYIILLCLANHQSLRRHLSIIPVGAGVPMAVQFQVGRPAEITWPRRRTVP